MRVVVEEAEAATVAVMPGFSWCFWSDREEKRERFDYGVVFLCVHVALQELRRGDVACSDWTEVSDVERGCGGPGLVGFLDNRDVVFTLISFDFILHIIIVIIICVTMTLL
ncbi:hypothetical protein NC652_037912 [Populus alba x Populus x berolinensis]|nr:hypothetical protein NC652_037912 [Populus alba x Populus x berolinensis]